MDNNQNDLKFKKNPKFKKGDIFYINRKGDKKYGTVKHVRTAYGGPPYTYMVCFDDPNFKEHNAYETYMNKLIKKSSDGFN